MEGCAESSNFVKSFATRGAGQCTIFETMWLINMPAYLNATELTGLHEVVGRPQLYISVDQSQRLKYSAPAPAGPSCLPNSMHLHMLSPLTQYQTKRESQYILLLEKPYSCSLKLDYLSTIELERELSQACSTVFVLKTSDM